MQIQICNDETGDRKIYIDPKKNTHEYDSREKAERQAKKLSRWYGRAIVLSGSSTLAEYVSGEEADWMKQNGR